MSDFLSTSRHPFEVYTLALCVVVGFPLLLGDATPNSISALLPRGAQLGWGAMLSLGALVALAGVLWRDRVSGLLLEQVGLVSVGGATVVYAAAALKYNGIAAAVPSAVVFAFGMSCFSRYVQIRNQLKAVQRLVSR